MSLYRFCRVVARPFVAMLWPTKIINKEYFFEKMLPEGGIVICNHYAIQDTLIQIGQLYKKEIHVLAKAEAFQNKFANKFLRSCGAIPIKRGEADIEATKAVLTVLRNNKILSMYPEGTRNKAGTEQMREFKQGCARFALKTQNPILPMIYFKKHKTFHRNYLYIGEPFDLSEFYGDRSQDAFERATQKVYDKMVETRELCNKWVEENNPKMFAKQKKKGLDTEK